MEGRQKIFTKDDLDRIRESYSEKSHSVNKNQWEKQGKSMRDLARENGCAVRTIQRVLNGSYEA